MKILSILIAAVFLTITIPVFAQPTLSSGCGTGAILEKGSTNNLGKVILGSNPENGNCILMNLPKPANDRVCNGVDESQGSNLVPYTGDVWGIPLTEEVLYDRYPYAPFDILTYDCRIF